MRKSLLLTLRFGIMFLLMTAGFFYLYTLASDKDTYYHENAHAMTCLYHGGNATITYNKTDGGGRTECKGADSPSDVIFLNSLMEIVGYHTYATTNAMFMVAFAILCGLFILVYAIMMERLAD